MSTAPCTHEWAFTTPNHIKCTRCPAIGQSWPSRAERVEFKRGRWIHLMPRPATPEADQDASLRA